MAKDGFRYKYLDEKVPSDGPLRRKGLQKIYKKERALMKRFELLCFDLLWMILSLCRSFWLTPHVVQGVLCPAEEDTVSEMRRSCALQQLLGL